MDQRLLVMGEPAEVVRMRIDKLVADLDDVPPATLAKILMAKALDVSLEAVGALATIQMVSRAGDLLGGRWSAETKRLFVSTNNY